MIVTAYRTPKIVVGTDLFTTLDACLPKLKEQSVVVVTSKIISICQGRVIINDGTVSKTDLIRHESQLYMEEENSAKWGIILTVKDDTLIASSGIDESNGNGYFILWPNNSANTAFDIWNYLRSARHLKHLGVIIADSHTMPLRWGVTGIGIGWCGFSPLKSYIGEPDIFGRPLHVTKASILDGLAASAVLAMGEGKEQTPLSVITDIPFVRFSTKPPSGTELKALHISMREDIFSPLINSRLWKKGGQK